MVVDDLYVVCVAASSLAIGLALAEGRLGAAEAFAAAELDSTFQLEHWGEDPEETRRRAAIRADLEAAARFLGLLG
jgi:chaperone required for assembly of F1-ATPase